MVSSFVTCSYCQSEFYIPPAAGFRIPEPRAYPQPAGLALLQVGSASYRVHGRLARGQHCDVFLARRERALTEMVILKVARQGGDEGLRREWRAIGTARDRHDYLRRLLPWPVTLDSARYPGQPERQCAVYRWRSGFLFTFPEARAAYPGGVDPRATLWMWNRILDQLACLHDVGLAHNAIAPEHLLIHPRDHGVVLCGWSESGAGDAREDVAQSGRCIASLLGPAAPKALRELALHACCFEAATACRQELGKVSEAAYGPPRFHKFEINGGQHGIR
jgi:hypothetical protein